MELCITVLVKVCDTADKISEGAVERILFRDLLLNEIDVYSSSLLVT